MAMMEYYGKAHAQGVIPLSLPLLYHMSSFLVFYQFKGSRRREG